MSSTKLIAICGVSGCGKTTIGKKLAEKLNYEFIDADDYHTVENKTLMSNGIGLNDEQRRPWLLNLYNKLKEIKSNNQNAVLACSALKSKYRYLLNYGLNNENQNQFVDDDQIFLNIKFILLNIDYDLVHERLSKRKHAFVNGAAILDSQFQCLEIHYCQNLNDGFSYILEMEQTKSVEDCVNEIENFILKNI